MNTARLTLGERVFINARFTVDGFEHVTIGDDCWLGVNVTLLTSSHRIGSPALRAGEITSAPITIGNGCWLGAGVTVLPGVAICAGCVIGAGAVVTKSLDANGLYVGSPARLVRPLGLSATADTDVNGSPAGDERNGLVGLSNSS